MRQPGVQSRCRRWCRCYFPQNSKQANSLLCCGGFGLALAIALIIVAATVPSYIINYVDEALIEAIIIDSPDAPGTENWMFNKNSPTRMEVYLLDVLNPTEIINEGARPSLIERGPFVYWGYKQRYNLSWSQDGEVLSWREWEYYTFDEKLSAESDTGRLITSLYMPFIGLRAGLTKPGGNPLGRNYMLLIFQVLMETTERERVFCKKTARDLLWGYSDPVMEMANMLDPNIDPVFPGFLNNYTSPAAQEARKGVSNYFEFYTGKNRHGQMRHWRKWRNMTHITACSKAPCPPNPTVDAWATHEAGLIRGSDGSAFAPPITRDHRLPVWFGNYFRTIDLVYSEHIMHKEVELLRFTLPDSADQNSTNVPANALYNQHVYNGFFNISALTSDAPILICKPHFRDSDPEVAEQLDVIWRPQEEEVFETSFDVEPISGAGFHARSSSMLTVGISPLDRMPLPDNETAEVTWFPNMRSLQMPVFWATQEAGIPDKEAADFVAAVYGALFLSDVARYVGAMFGTLALLLGLAGVVVAIVKKNHFKQFGEDSVLIDSGPLPEPQGKTEADDMAQVDISYGSARSQRAT